MIIHGGIGFQLCPICLGHVGWQIMDHLANLDDLKSLGCANGQLFQALMKLGFHIIWKNQSVSVVDEPQNGKLNG